MREIKFRFWDSIEGIWCDRNWLESNANEVLFGWLTLDNIPKEIHVMQYTGLKDKNGTDIYEGDIIGFPAYGGKYTVTFSHGVFTPFAAAEPANCLVVGNIWENPDLLQS